MPGGALNPLFEKIRDFLAGKMITPAGAFDD
jgi:hypothetical protein